MPLLAAAGLAAWAVRKPDVRRVFDGRPGPWGELQYTRIAIEPPEEFLKLEGVRDFQPPRWVFGGLGREEVKALFQSAELTAEQRESLLSRAAWEELPGGVAVTPDRDLILGLNSSARRTLYTVLARSKENTAQTQPFSFRPEFLEERLESSGLSRTTVEGFTRLLYPQGDALIFADAAAYMSTLSDPREQMKFYRTIARRRALLVRLRVTPESDIDQLEHYWNSTGNQKELRPLFESLARVPEGCYIDVAHLLPPFARKRLFTFPPPSDDPKARRRDCHWTALNFFNDPPDDRFCDPATVKQVLDTEYEKIDGERRLGDLVVLFHPGGDVLHSAVYVADDIVFTKNGGTSTQPWTLMRLDDMISGYAACSPPESPPATVILRRKAKDRRQRAADSVQEKPARCSAFPVRFPLYAIPCS